jgi:tetraacyldisaccharide 4'-kinase
VTGFESLVSGERRGIGASAARGGLRVLGFLYGRVMAVRNAYYDTWAMPAWLDVPVVSVGNLTVGGTGKTPMTIWLCERLLERGRKPAVLSRGYKASAEGVADELLLVSRRVPQAVAIAHADRLRAGRMAIEQYQVKAAILDDGFQHRRLGRDLDILLIDATRPFGYGHILPGGLLRERISAMRRADAVIITRADQADAGKIATIEKIVREWNREAPIVQAVHEPSGFADLAGTPVDAPTDMRVGAIAGIARPNAFVRTLADLGLSPAATAVYPDHYAYSTTDVERIAAWARDEKLGCLLTTEKDAVKLARIGGHWPMPVVSVGIRIKMLDDGDTVLCGLIDCMLAEHDDSPANPCDPQEEQADGANTKESGRSS